MGRASECARSNVALNRMIEEAQQRNQKGETAIAGKGVDEVRVWKVERLKVEVASKLSRKEKARFSPKVNMIQVKSKGGKAEPKSQNPFGRLERPREDNHLFRLLL